MLFTTSMNSGFGNDASGALGACLSCSMYGTLEVMIYMLAVVTCRAHLKPAIA